MVQSSGSPALDQETLAMLVRAHPMPRPPQELSLLPALRVKKSDQWLNRVSPIRSMLAIVCN